MSLQMWRDSPSGFVAALLEAGEEFEAAHDAGILLVGAAGNLGAAGAEQPGAMPHVLTVGATTGCGFRHGFSNHGPSVDLWAPGRAYGAVLGGGHRWEAGTSFATPLVAGAAALLLQKEPGLSPDEVAARLVGAAVPSEDGPALAVHGLFGVPRPEGNARLDLVGPTDVGGRHHLQYHATGSEADLLELDVEGSGGWCLNLADPESAQFYVEPGPQAPLSLGARPHGATWQGEWANATFRHRDGAPAAGLRPVLAPASGDAGAGREAPVGGWMALGALALAAFGRRRD